MSRSRAAKSDTSIESASNKEETKDDTIQVQDSLVHRVNSQQDKLEKQNNQKQNLDRWMEYRKSPN